MPLLLCRWRSSRNDWLKIFLWLEFLGLGYPFWSHTINLTLSFTLTFHSETHTLSVKVVPYPLHFSPFLLPLFFSQVFLILLPACPAPPKQQPCSWHKRGISCMPKSDGLFIHMCIVGSRSHTHLHSHSLSHILVHTLIHVKPSHSRPLFLFGWFLIRRCGTVLCWNDS